ncbi:60S ribosomal protein L28-like [Rhinolophus ferrumequinum]|uniref:60S ribosomal protein L28-like n=1 Tax=Rhinolophus ferrumequinum TaxID=59479 RepID=UPI00140F8FC7|nr:60S ribosomal protein L28-like [Rhinolophus ferrumequinum]
MLWSFLKSLKGSQNPNKQWMVVCDCSSFLTKRNKQTYNTKSNNLKTHNSFCYNGLIHCKMVDVEPAANGKGVVVIIKQRSSQRKPATFYMWTTINENAQTTFSSIWHMIHKKRHGLDLRMATICRASAILCSQKSVTLMRKWAHPTNSS